jgi:hypothetical protein
MPADTRALKGCTPPRPAGCSRRLQLTRNVSRLGGPVGVELCELLRAQGKPVSGMIYAEGNLVTPARSCAPCSGAAMLALIPPKSVFSLRGAGVQDAGDCFGSARLVQKGCPLAPGEGASAARRERWERDRAKFWSSQDLVAVSEEGQLLPRIQVSSLISLIAVCTISCSLRTHGFHRCRPRGCSPLRTVGSPREIRHPVG